MDQMAVGVTDAGSQRARPKSERLAVGAGHVEGPLVALYCDCCDFGIAVIRLEEGIPQRIDVGIGITDEVVADGQVELTCGILVCRETVVDPGNDTYQPEVTSALDFPLVVRGASRIDLRFPPVSL